MKDKEFQFKSLKKIHRKFGHPSTDKLSKVFKGAAIDDKNIFKKLERIYDCCRVCRKYQRKDSKPKVGLPKAECVNQCVSVDLKPVSSLTGNSRDLRQIVYCVDEFSRFTKAGGGNPFMESKVSKMTKNGNQGFQNELKWKPRFPK